ncbi:MAG: roadblock/LC7 domain-containing protein [Promethearchaeota archaeon]
MQVYDRRLSDILSEVISDTSEINVSLLCSHEGFPIAFAMNSDKKEDEDITLLSAMSSAVHSISNQAVTQLNTGPLLTTTIEAAKGTLLMKDLGELVFVAHVPKTKKDEKQGARVRSYHIGIALASLDASAKKIKRYLTELEKESSE